MNSKRKIYILSAVILAVVVFVSTFLIINPRENPVFSSSENEIHIDSSGIEVDSGGISSDDGGGESSGIGPGIGPGPGEGGPSPIEPEIPIWFRIKSDEAKFTYLREDSKGDYVGNGEHGFEDSEKYYLKEGEISPLYYFAYSLEKSGYLLHKTEIELIDSKAELIPYFTTEKYQNEAGSLQYYVDNYSYDFISQGLEGISPIPSDYEEQELRYRQFVNDNYLDISTELKELLLDLASENRIVKNSASIYADVANYIKNAAYYDYYYALNDYPKDKDMVTYFLTEHKRGVCRHFAAAATMMYRALGIPARYTIGFALTTSVDKWIEYSGDGHAWVEVYLDGYGWVPIEVTGSNMYVPNDSENPNVPPAPSFPSGPELPDTNETISFNFTVINNNPTKVYDGKPLTNTDIIITDLSSKYSYEIVYYTELTTVGSVINKLQLEFYNKNGVMVARKTVNAGVLTVTHRQMILTTAGKTSNDANSVLTCYEYTCEGLVTSDRVYSLKITGKQVGAGFSDNTFDLQSLVIVNENGENVTFCYAVEEELGQLIING